MAEEKKSNNARMMSDAALMNRAIRQQERLERKRKREEDNSFRQSYQTQLEEGKTTRFERQEDVLSTFMNPRNTDGSYNPFYLAGDWVGDQFQFAFGEIEKNYHGEERESQLTDLFNDFENARDEKLMQRFSRSEVESMTLSDKYYAMQDYIQDDGASYIEKDYIELMPVRDGIDIEEYIEKLYPKQYKNVDFKAIPNKSGMQTGYFCKVKSIEDIYNKLDRIVQDQNPHPFTMLVNFGYVQGKEGSESELMAFSAFSGIKTNFFETSRKGVIPIRTRADMKAAKHMISKETLRERYSGDASNTFVHAVATMYVKVFKLDGVLGCVLNDSSLDVLKNNHSISIWNSKDEKKHNLCVFLCIAAFKNQDPFDSEKYWLTEAKEWYNKFYEQNGVLANYDLEVRRKKKYKGTNFMELEDIEQKFQFRFKFYQVHATRMRTSKGKYETKYTVIKTWGTQDELLLFEDTPDEEKNWPTLHAIQSVTEEGHLHLSYIHKDDVQADDDFTEADKIDRVLCNLYRCNKCFKPFDTLQNLETHLQKFRDCNGDKRRFRTNEPDLIVQPPNTIKRLLDEYHVCTKDTTKYDFSKKYFAFWDFESLCESTRDVGIAMAEYETKEIEEKREPEDPLKTEKRKQEKIDVQRPIHCSIATNLPNCEESNGWFKHKMGVNTEETCYVKNIFHEDSFELVWQLYTDWMYLQKLQSQINEEVYAKPLKWFRERKQKCLEEQEKIKKKRKEEGKLYRPNKNHPQIRNCEIFESHCKKLCILGFNSSGYDLLLAKQYDLFTHLQYKTKPSIIQSGNKYKMLSDDYLVFLDLKLMYIPTSFENLCKSFKTGMLKSFFPYQYLDSVEKLNVPLRRLKQSDFYSSLKNSSISNDDWNYFQMMIEDDRWEGFSEDNPKTEEKTLLHLLRYYNTMDVIPAIEIITTLSKFWNENGICMFSQFTLASAAKALIMRKLWGADFEKFFHTQRRILMKRAQTPMLRPINDDDVIPYTDDYLEKKIARYTHQDTEKDRVIDNMIDLNQFKEKIILGGNKCSYCKCELTCNPNVDFLDPIYVAERNKREEEEEERRKNNEMMEKKNEGEEEDYVTSDEEEEEDDGRFIKIYEDHRAPDTLTLDRINNSLCHMYENTVLACLECNNKRGSKYFSDFFRKVCRERYHEERSPMLFDFTEKNKDVHDAFREKKNLHGGFSGVFHRKIEKGDPLDTYNHWCKESRKWIIKKRPQGLYRRCKRIVSLDVNSLYPTCYALCPSLCGPLYFHDAPDAEGAKDLLRKVRSGEFFGCVEVTMHVDENHPKYNYDYYAPLPPFARKQVITPEMLSEESIRIHKVENDGKLPRKTLPKLILGMHSEHHQLLLSDDIKWLLEHGCVVSSVGRYIPATRGFPFKNAIDQMIDQRRAGDCLECYMDGLDDPSKCSHIGEPGHPDKWTSLIAKLMKIVMNSFYGGTLVNKANFSETVLMNEEKAWKAQNDLSNFLYSQQVNEDMYEVQREKSSYNFSNPVPIQVGFAVLGYSKLHMRKLIYDFIDVYLDRGSWKMLYTDTDSAYLALAGKTLDDCVKPELRAKYKIARKKFVPDFSRTANGMREMRTLGLSKEEASGTHFIGLASKSYKLVNLAKKRKRDSDEVVYEEENVKQGQKGINLSLNPELKKRKTMDHILQGNKYHGRNHTLKTTIAPQGESVSSASTNVFLGSRSVGSYLDKQYLHDDGIHCSPLDTPQIYTPIIF